MPITIEYEYSDGIELTIDGGEPVLDNLGYSRHRNDSTVLNFAKLNQFYRFQIRWKHFLNNHYVLIFRMFYNSTTCNSVDISSYDVVGSPTYLTNVIPGDNWHNDIIVINPTSSLPYNITVTCPDGYEQNATTDKCIEVAGNGFRTGSEV